MRVTRPSRERNTPHIMLVKYRVHKGRANAVAFHSKRPWVAVGYHSGLVEIYDYSLGILTDSISDAKGPIRAVAFHPSLPFLATGGDDTVVRLYDFQRRKCIATFKNHDDYVRCIDFHPTLPWILAGGDDMTIRIWNFAQRSYIAVLMGHVGGVTSARFHPTKDLVVSGSYDMTVRVWDCSEVKSKHSTSRLRRLAMELLTQPETVLANAVVGIGHTGVVTQVLWDQASEQRPYDIITVSEDRTIRTWQYQTSVRGSVVQQLRHARIDCNGWVNCIVQSHAGLLVTGSDDGDLHFINRQGYHECETYSVGSRVWQMDQHPTRNLYAVAHSTGFFLFTEAPERTASVLASDGKTAWVCLNRRIQRRLLVEGNSRPTTLTRLPAELARADAFGAGNLLMEPRSIYVSPGATAERGPFPIVVNYFDGVNHWSRVLTRPYNDSDGDPASSPETRAMMRQLNSQGKAPVSPIGYPDLSQLTHDYSCTTNEEVDTDDLCITAASDLVPVGVNAFACLSLDVPGAVDVYSLRNNTLMLQRTIKGDATEASALLPGGPGRVFLSYHREVVLMDIHESKELARIPVAEQIRRAVWSPSGTQVALVSQKSVTLVKVTDSPSISLQIQSSEHLCVRVKDAVWVSVDPAHVSGDAQPTPTSRDVLFFVTITHIRYLLENGDSGILTSVHRPIYLLALVGSQLWYVDRHRQVQHLDLNLSLVGFQHALLHRSADEVVELAKRCKDCGLGHALLSYLYGKGHYDVALLLADDVRTRFALATRGSQLDVAGEAATQLNDSANWRPLAEAAMRMGDTNFALWVVQRAGASEAGMAAFIAAVSGDQNRAQFMASNLARHAEQLLERETLHGAMQLAVLANSGALKTAVLHMAGQPVLAFLTGLHNIATMNGDEVVQANDADIIARIVDLLIPKLPDQFFFAGTDITAETLKEERRSRLASFNMLPPTVPQSIEEVLLANGLDPNTKDQQFISMAQRELESRSLQAQQWEPSASDSEHYEASLIDVVTKLAQRVGYISAAAQPCRLASAGFEPSPWPRVSVKTDFFGDLLSAEQTVDLRSFFDAPLAHDATGEAPAWGDELDIELSDIEPEPEPEYVPQPEQSVIEQPVEPQPVPTHTEQTISPFVPYEAGPPPLQQLCIDGNLPAAHLAFTLGIANADSVETRCTDEITSLFGPAETAMPMIRPLLDICAATSTVALPGAPGSAPIYAAAVSNSVAVQAMKEQPNISREGALAEAVSHGCLLNVKLLERVVELAFQDFERGSFQSAQDELRSVLAGAACLVSSHNARSSSDLRVQSIVRTAARYLLAIQIEATRRSIQTEDKDTALLLAGLFGSLQFDVPSHTLLALRVALGAFTRSKHYDIAKVFAAGILENSGNANDSTLKTVRRVLDLGNTAIAEGRISTIPGMPAQGFVLGQPPLIDVTNLKVLEGPAVFCPLCGSATAECNAGQSCPICRVASFKPKEF